MKNKNLQEVSKIFESKIRIQMLASLSVSSLTYPQLKEICQCTDGNMATHTKKLIDAEYITVKKYFLNNKPTTEYNITTLGKKELQEYINIISKLL